MVSKAYRAQSPSQLMGLRVALDGKKNWWIKGHADDAEFRGLPEGKKLEAMCKFWASMVKGVKIVPRSPKPEVKAAKSSYQQLPPM